MIDPSSRMSAPLVAGDSRIPGLVPGQPSPSGSDPDGLRYRPTLNRRRTHLGVKAAAATAASVSDFMKKHLSDMLAFDLAIRTAV
ncbi:MAG: hypothetical protein OXE53_02955 [Deltaproteobacteria bacterium]|nr:hypothetical protein [Deltaproteobacteria bacterium]